MPFWSHQPNRAMARLAHSANGLISRLEPHSVLDYPLPSRIPGRGALLAQFWISIPVFIIAEANLGALGLGVAEPLPSLGSLLRELQDSVMVRPEPWRLLPLAVLIVVISSFQVLLNRQEIRT